jgi:hypothetical protein
MAGREIVRLWPATKGRGTVAGAVNYYLNGAEVRM